MTRLNITKMMITIKATGPTIAAVKTKKVESPVLSLSIVRPDGARV